MLLVSKTWFNLIVSNSFQGLEGESFLIYFNFWNVLRCHDTFKDKQQINNAGIDSDCLQVNDLNVHMRAHVVTADRIANRRKIPNLCPKRVTTRLHLGFPPCLITPSGIKNVQVRPCAVALPVTAPPY